MTKSNLKRIGDNAANNISNFAGRQVPLQIASYCGNGSGKSGNMSTLITNLSDEDLTVALFFGAIDEALSDYIKNKYGIQYFLIEGTIDDGEDTPSDVLTVETKRFPLSAFQTKSMFNPMQIVKFRLSAYNTTDNQPNERQFKEVISRAIIDPLTAKEDVLEIDLNQAIKLDSFKNGIVDVPEGFVVDSNSVVFFKVAKKTILGIDAEFGLTVNTGKGLEKMTK